MKFNWGHGILAFLIIFLLLLAAFIVFSFKQKHDMVTKDYYKKGADYTTQMKINQRSELYIDSVNISFVQDDVVLSCAQSITDMDDSLQVLFYRPSDKDLDYECTLPIMDNKSIISKNFLARGRYLVNIQWSKKEDLYQIKKDVFIK